MKKGLESMRWILGILLIATFGISQAQAQWQVSPHNTKLPGEAGYRVRHQQTGLELVYVPAGSFIMGITAAEEPAAIAELGRLSQALASRITVQQPAHEVELSAYWIGHTEVTVEQWRRAMGAMPPPDDSGRDRNSLGDNHPVTRVTWQEAASFCTNLGLRLPTEAEWEYAARGPQRRIFPWGDTWDETKCCNGKNQYRTVGVGFRTFPVGSFPNGASWCGAMDMAGNLWEWCSDWYDPGYYAGSPRVNPQGPAAGYLKSARGGAYGSDGPHNFRSSARGTAPADIRQYGYGFRAAMSGAGLTGTVELQDFRGSLSLSPVRIEVRDAGGSLVRTSDIILPANPGGYFIENLPSGTYSVSFRASKFLTSVKSVQIGESLSICNASLANGDMNGDGLVGQDDLSISIGNVDSAGDKQ